MMMHRALGVYEYWKTRLFMESVKQGMTVVDIGVNKGFYSLLAAKLMNDKGKVLSFEPVSLNCHWIKKSIKVNNYKSIELYPIALSDNNGKAKFYVGKKSGWGSFVFSNIESKSNKQTIYVNTKKLDDFIVEKGISKIDLMKIDVEGSALMVLNGAEETLRRMKNIKLIIDLDYRREQDKEIIFSKLHSWGFQIYNIGKKLTPVNRVEDAVMDVFAVKKPI
jgi:FkbM family methyltransferase